MYLSRLVINPRSRRGCRELGNVYELHRTIMRAFGGTARSDLGRVLFRVDVEERGQSASVLVQSEWPPSWEFLARSADFLTATPDPNPAVKEFGLVFRAEQTLAFRLRANPSKTENATGKRLGVLGEVEQKAWLRRKGEQGGFAVRRVVIVPEGQIVGWKERETPAMTLASARFQGVLEVTDSERFTATLRQGIGHGKALGFGLLSLAPAKRAEEHWPDAERPRTVD